MPKKVEEALRKVARKLAQQGKLRGKPTDTLEEKKDRFIFGTMANMKKRRGGKW